jgi:hypothetical protein
MGGPGTDRPINSSPVPGKGRVALLYLVLTVLLAYPLSLRPASLLIATDPDIQLFMWLLAWNTHAFVNQPLSIFDANIFHPQPNTLAYSENIIGSALFAAPVLWLTDNPVLAFNLVSLLTCVLCGLGAYVLARRVGIGSPGATLCGIIFAFSPARFFRISQLHLSAVQWIPFALASLHAYLDGGRKRDLRLAAGFISLQALTSGHGIVFLAVAAGTLLAYRFALGEPLAFVRRLRDLGVSGALLLAPTVLVFLPYRRAQADVGLRRPLAGWAPSPESFLAAPTHVQMYVLSFFPEANVIEKASAFLFPGYVPLLLAGAALLWGAAGLVPRRWRARRPAPALGRGWRRAALALEVVALASLAIGVWVAAVGPIRLRWDTTLLLSARDPLRPWVLFAVAAALRVALARRAPLEFLPRLRRRRETYRQWAAPWRQSATGVYVLVTLAGLLLAAGPPIGIWPFVYWMPVLNFIRVPSRFIILAVLGLAVLAAIGFDRLSARLGPRRRAVVGAFLGAFLAAEFVSIPLPSVLFRVEIPPVHRWLARQPKPFVLAEVPVWAARNQTMYMLYSTAHWQKTVNGYSGLEPPGHSDLYSKLRNFPDEVSLRMLQEFGVTYVVVHAEMYAPEDWTEVRERLARFASWLTLEYEEGSGRVYSLRHAAADGRP